MKKRGKKKEIKKEDLVEKIKELNKSLIIEIFVLIYFIVSMFLKISWFIIIPITVLVFLYEEFKITRLREEIGFDNSGELYKIIGMIVAFFGFTLFFTSPFFIKAAVQLALPLAIIVIGAFVFLISKFYDKPRIDLRKIAK